MEKEDRKRIESKVKKERQIDRDRAGVWWQGGRQDKTCSGRGGGAGAGHWLGGGG